MITLFFLMIVYITNTDDVFFPLFSLYSASVSFLRFLYRCCVPRVLSVLNEVLLLFTFLCSESFPLLYVHLSHSHLLFECVFAHVFFFSLFAIPIGFSNFTGLMLHFFFLLLQGWFFHFLFLFNIHTVFIRLGFLFVFSDSSADVLSSFLS